MRDRFHRKSSLNACVLLGLLLLLCTRLVHAQSGGSVVEGVVRDAGKRPLADVRVWLDDQLEGRTQGTQTDGAGHFRFGGVAASTYQLRLHKPGYLDRAEGPFATGREETKTLNLEMAEAQASGSG